MAKQLRTLGWDYFMFVAFVLITVFGPLWKRIFGKKKQRSKADYVFATGGISIVAIMLSIARGTLGVRTVLGYPSELFYRGSAMWEIIYGMVSAYPIVCFVFVPVYFNLGITSVYQYIDLRFKSRLVRCLASATYIVRQICSLGITVYTPSVALSTVIGIPYWASIVGMAVICIFFTIMGGLKAAINADVIQTVTVILVTLAVIVKGLIASGGAKHVYEVNRDNDRLQFFNFSGDMTVRVDTLSAWLGQLFMSLSQFGCQQNFMQRYVSLKSMSQVRRVMMTNIPIIFVFFSLSWLSGMVIYATYVNCDPYAEGYISKPDEILPFFVEDQLAVIPGFVGIFMAMLFNGALCMMVSNLNSLATVCWEDFISQLPQFKGLSDKQQLFILKVITVICGLIIMGVAFGVGLLSGVIESSLLAFSATSGPLLGCFILAMLVPIANWKGTSAGMISSCAFVIWIITGSATLDKSGQNIFLPTSTEGCTNTTFSQSIIKPKELAASWLASHSLVNETSAMQLTLMAPERTPMETFYSVSYMYYSLLGAVIAVGVGVIISYLTRDPKDAYDAKLLHPMVLRWCERFPGEKPYIIGEATSDLTSGEKEKGTKVNHAFDVQTEANIIIGTSNEKQKHNPIEVVFTKGQNDKKTEMPVERSITTGNLAKEAELDTPPSGGENGTYRQFKEKESV
ncbi:PREDICTED: sodium-coupled monocarboxylate transporter 1 [Rhagoletis zephyria]|uniref:sodium-coupled monocarboxylate transporter 1 n=1 Tax=Rhagoletis zephyria TaxID=28612 RepID=UPI0008113298|nr:PREDICTED: sodium-coupled monocarboxylate transporter 1 [Rhagoletis zephyria]